MDKKDLQSFIHFFTHNKNLTRVQRLKRDELLARDVCLSSQKSDGASPETAQDLDEQSGIRGFIFKTLSPLDTALFLSLFNNPMGLKYLTHDFDPIDDGRPQSLQDLYKQVSSIMQDGRYQIPSSLWVLINSFLKGNKPWVDTYGTSHNSYINLSKWIEWSSLNKMHPINNPEFSKEIMAFRSTIRLVTPQLKEICEKAKKGLSITLTEDKLEKADFYTNTYILYIVIKRIFTMMDRRNNKYPKVHISYKRTTDLQGRMLRQIVITQKGSFADRPIEEARERLLKASEAGDFGSIRNSLNGYCLWQVESLWDGLPFRWNVLKTEEMSEFDRIDKSDVIGFTHILTYYLL